MGGIDTDKFKKFLEVGRKLDSTRIEMEKVLNAMGTAREERTGLASSVEDAHRGSISNITHGDVDDVIDDDAASFSVGDSVQITGLVSATQYNDMRGIVINDFDPTTNRCGVKVRGGKGLILALQVHNLTLIRKAKKSSNVDVEQANNKSSSIVVDIPDDIMYSAINNEAERSKLQQENMAILRDFEAFTIPFSGLSSPALNIQPTTRQCPCCLHVHKPDMWGFIARSIIEKWREQASSTTGFIRFLNGISTDCREENMQLVSLRDALVNINEWKVDWDKKLTPNEIRKVNNQNYWRSMILDQGNDLDEEIKGTEYEDIIDDEIERSLHNYGLNSATDSHNTKQAARIMKNFRKCKKDAVNSLLSTLGRDNLDSYQQALVDRGLISITLGFLNQCEHEDFNDMVGRVKGNLRTPVDWITILAHLGNVEQCKLEIANGIQAVIRCLCDDTKRLFFKSNKYWHEAVGEFAVLLLCLLRPSSADLSLKVTTTTVYNLLQSEGFLESIVQKQFWSSHRPDLVQEYESYPHSFGIKRHEAFFHDVIRSIIFIGLKRESHNTTSNPWICEFCGLEFDNYVECASHEVGCSKNNQPGEGPPSSLSAVVTMAAWPVVDLIKTIVKTPVVSRAYNPKCNVYFILGMIQMLKNVNSDDSIDQRKYLDTLLIVFTTLMFTADCVDHVVIQEVIDLGRRFTNNIDDAMSISKVSFTMLVRKEHGNMYPIDKRIAFAIKSGMLEMCFEFITRFECVQLIAPDPSRDELMRRFRMMEALVCIAELIQDVALHQKTAKAIRDHRSQIMEVLSTMSIEAKTEQSLQFFEILSSVIDLNEGSCSRCNKPIDWRTALFCAGCRRVAYCGLKCQKKDWKHGTHSSNCPFLTRSADLLGLTTFEVKSSRNISKLTGLRNNIVTNQKKLFLMHEVALSNQLLKYLDRRDRIAVFDLSNKEQPMSVVHYQDQLTCSTQRKWFEEFRSPDKIICVFMSHVLNGEFGEDGNTNIISLWTAFPLPRTWSTSLLNNHRDDASARCCDECGNEGGVSLKTCMVCMSVKYCNASCQHKHWPEHKKRCKLRAAKLRDEALFKDPPPKENCPICFVPMPVKMISCISLPPATISSVPIYDFAIANEAIEPMEQYYECCGKTICNGCTVFQGSDNDDKCPFCSSNRSSKTLEERVEYMMKRAEANEPTSIIYLASHYQHGKGGLQQDGERAIKLYTRAAELGTHEAHYHLGHIYDERGDLKKAKFHYEAAAMTGHELARGELGVMEAKSGNMEQAVKHWKIAASAGSFYAMHEMRVGFEKGYVNRESINSTLVAYNNSCAEMRSEARDAYMRRFY